MKSKPYTREPRWRVFMQQAMKAIEASGGYREGSGVASIEEQLAVAIMDLGHGQEFLKAVRRARSTQRQNLRYRMLREVEKFCGDRVKRRRPDANTPDAVALRDRPPAAYVNDLKLEFSP